MLSVSSILWPSDGSDASMKALDAAVAIAEKFGAKLHVLQVVHQVPTLTGVGIEPTSLQGFDVPLYEQELVTSAEKGLRDTVANKVNESVEVIAEVRIGVPADMIDEYVKENNIGMIVMATHGRTGLSHFMLGSVAEKTIRQTTVPTLIIPSGEEGGD